MIPVRKHKHLSEPLQQTANFIHKLTAENCICVRTEKTKLMSMNKHGKYNVSDVIFFMLTGSKKQEKLLSYFFIMM